MARKLDRPERADFLRVFARCLLVDEEYEMLTREEWGSVFLLMLQQWAKRGTLPDDREKLAHFAKCSVEELDQLLTKWPKIKPIPDHPGRVGIPYVWREWCAVMSYYADQRVRSLLGVDAKRTKPKPSGEPTGSPMGSNPDPIPCPEEPSTDDWFERTWAIYSGLTPPPRQESIPSSNKAACRKRWRKIVSSSKVTDQELAYCVQGYIEHRTSKREFFQALETVIGVRKPSWQEHLTQARAWITEELKKDGINE